MSNDFRQLTIVLENLAGGGEERILTNLMNYLAEEGWDIDLVLVKKEGAFLNQLSSKIRVHYLATRNVYLSLFPLVRYLRRFKPSIVLSSLDLMNLITLLAVRMARVETRSIIRVASLVSKQIRTPIKKLLEKAFLSKIYPWADRIMVVSKDAAIDLSAYTGIPLDEISAIYNPVIFPTLELKMQEQAGHPWVEDSSTRVILAVGRLTKSKNFARLLKAFQIVRKHRNVKLVILGEGELRIELEALTADLGIAEDVAMPGFVENPYAYMRSADVFVLSSDYEGLPTVLIEALACGCPVVSTNCPSGPREILADGKYGELVALDPNALAKGINAVLDGDVKKIDDDWLNQFKMNDFMNAFLQLIKFD